jgi:hypothetical protein
MDGPDPETLLSRIQDLLNKTVSNGATEVEAQAARAAAQRLMDAHNIALVEVVEHDADAVDFALAEVVEHDADAVDFGHEGAWEGLYDAAIALFQESPQTKAVRCLVLRTGWFRLPGHGLVGRTRKIQIFLICEEVNRDAAKGFLDFTARLFRQFWDAYRIGREGADRWTRGAYVSGLVAGFRAGVREERAGRERERPGATNALEDPGWADEDAYEAGRDIGLWLGGPPMGGPRARGPGDRLDALIAAVREGGRPTSDA